MKPNRWLETLLALLIAVVTQGVIFGFPGWGLNAMSVALTPLLQLVVGFLLTYLTRYYYRKKGGTFSYFWLVLIWGVSLGLDVCIAWYAIHRDM